MPAPDDSARNGNGHGCNLRGDDRRAGALREIALGRGLCRADFQTVPIRCSRLRRSHLQTRGPIVAENTERSGQLAALPSKTRTRNGAQELGHGFEATNEPQEGRRRLGAQAGCDHARDLYKWRRLRGAGDVNMSDT